MVNTYSLSIKEFRAYGEEVKRNFGGKKRKKLEIILIKRKLTRVKMMANK